MTVWLVLGVMTLVALGFTVAPLLGRAGRTAGRREHELEVYRAQLSELEQERARGLIGEDEARAARLEIQRRMLAADAAAAALEATPEAGTATRGAPKGTKGKRGGKAAMAMPVVPRGRRRPALAGALALGLLGIAGGTYGLLGSPDQPGQPFASRTDTGGAVVAGTQAAPGGPAAQATEPGQVPPVGEMVTTLEAQVAEDPDNLDLLTRLARAYELMQRPSEAAQTYRQVIELNPDLGGAYAALAEALIVSAGGIVTPEARSAIERALELEPTMARARFYDGLQHLQAGRRQEALDAWVALAAESPADAPWLPTVQERIQAVAVDLGLDPDDVMPEPLAVAGGAPAPQPGTGQPAGPAGPAAGGLAALPETAEEAVAEAAALDQTLADNPRDWQGWIRLAQLRAALGEAEAAETALAEGAEEFAGAPFLQQQFAAVAGQLGVAAPGASGPAAPGGNAPRGPTPEQVQAAQQMSPQAQQEMIQGMVTGLAERLEREPDDLEGWLMLGRSYRVLGDLPKSVEAFKRAAGLMPEGSSQRSEVEAMIEALEAQSG